MHVHSIVFISLIGVGACQSIPVDSNAPPVAAATQLDSEVVRIYNNWCASCHADAVNGAPRPGIATDWEGRLAYGITELYLNVIDGLGVRMPPRGMCFECTDTQLQAIVDYMISDLH